MSLCVNSVIVAEVATQNVTLQPILGAYELGFGLAVSIHQARERAYEVSLRNARVTVTGANNEPQVLGWAWPERTFSVRQKDSSSRNTPQFLLTLQPAQLKGIEELRGISDLKFELHANGIGYDQNGEAPVEDTWQFVVPRSKWIEQLGRANARDILLLEVPLPFPDAADETAKIGHIFKNAEEQFRGGNYTGAVAEIRKFVEALGKWRFEQEHWAGKSLSQLATKNEREAMSKHERETALWATIRHYTHPAHHVDSDGSTSEFSRSEAKLILTLVAALFARPQEH